MYININRDTVSKRIKICKLILLEHKGEDMNRKMTIINEKTIIDKTLLVCYLRQLKYFFMFNFI